MLRAEAVHILYNSQKIRKADTQRATRQAHQYSDPRAENNGSTPPAKLVVGHLFVRTCITDIYHLPQTRYTAPALRY